MLGRLFFMILGLAVAGGGYVLWRPDSFSPPLSFDLGPFAPYRTVICALLAVIGVVVVVAGLLRREPRSPRPQPPAETMADPAHEHNIADDATFVFNPTPPDIAGSHLPQSHAPGTHASEEMLPDARAEPAPPAPPPRPPSPANVCQTAMREGDELMHEGRAADAIEPYQQAVALARKAKDEVHDPAAARDLADALSSLAIAQDDMGRLDAAIGLHEESLGLRRELAASQDPADIRRLCLALQRLADCREARGHRSRARDLYAESLAIEERMAADSPDDALLRDDLAATRRRIAELDGAAVG